LFSIDSVFLHNLAKSVKKNDNTESIIEVLINENDVDKNSAADKIHILFLINIYRVNHNVCPNVLL